MDDNEREQVRSLLRSKLAVEELNLFRNTDLDLLASNGFTLASVFAAADENSLTAVLPDRIGLVRLLLKTFVQSQPPAEGGSSSKRPREGAPETYQSFVQSAREDYTKWEKADDKSILSLSVDPFLNVRKGFFLWVRECYEDLKKILVEAKESERFIVVGTSGIGMSYFSVFWICYLASKKEEVVWKVANTFYLLDFSDEDATAAKAYGPFRKFDRELREVFENPAAWLIMDGAQERPFGCECRILLVCSTKTSNYKQFAKKDNTRILCMPVWKEEEICKFLDAFEKRRADYLHMDVLDKKKVMERFELVGGVPRYILCATQFEERYADTQRAIHYLEMDASLKRFSGIFEADETGITNDCLFHINCEDRSYDIESMFYDFASPYVKIEFDERFHKLSKVAVVDYLDRHFTNLVRFP